ncbi:hypothetical protein V8E53_002091 [Lactarius tabidus]
MPPAGSTRKTKSVAKEVSAPSEKTITRASQRKALTPKTDDMSQLMEEELPTTPVPPKRQEVDNLPIQNVAEAPGTKTTDKPTGDTHISSNVKSKKKAPVPTRDPLPAREDRNTHPGVHFGLQLTPCQSSQQVVAEHGNKEFEGLDEVDSNKEDSPSPEPGKEVKVLLGKLLRECRTRISKKWGKDCTWWEGKKVQHNEVAKAEQDLLLKKYNQAGAEATTMGYFIPEPTIGGLNNDQVATKYQMVGLSCDIKGENDQIALYTSVYGHAPRLNQLPPSQQSFDQLKTKHLLIASDVLKLVKTYFEDARFIDQPEEVSRHAWWALCPDNLAYHAKPAPINAEDIRSVDYHPEGRYWSAFISPVEKKFPVPADGSAILPPIGPHKPLIGLYILILATVKCTFMLFGDSIYKVPPQFSNEYMWHTI